MGDIFYSEASNRNKIATIRQYAEVIVRKILDINPSQKMTIGANEISKKIDTLKNSKFLKEALENIKQDGNKFTYTEYLGEVTSDEFDIIVDKLLDMLSLAFPNGYVFFYIGKSAEKSSQIAKGKDDSYMWLFDEQAQNSFYLSSSDEMLDIKLLSLYKLFDKSVDVALFAKVAL